MIPRHQRILFWVLLAASVIMALVLIGMRQRAHERTLSASDTMPMNPPGQASAQDVTYVLANDLKGSVTEERLRLTLPADPNARAQVILQHLIAQYGEPKSTHPIAPNNGVTEVFFMPLPDQTGAGSSGTMAVVNLSGSFVAAHPSGIEPETLTLLSLIGTLHANFPQITQVRFLVDGQPRDTLAGHADLTRVYLASESPGPKHP
ncbi:MAG TPA: GerMN domain-containing protein [Acidobacteriaceae bacterium]|nr:GerMN domain-containing protein [Acidobacteriaceae bacterium]